MLCRSMGCVKRGKEEIMKPHIYKNQGHWCCTDGKYTAYWETAIGAYEFLIYLGKNRNNAVAY